jgi:hypothetical protein
MFGDAAMKQISFGRFLILVLFLSLIVGVAMLWDRPARGVIAQEIIRLNLVKANLRKAGMLTPKKDKIISAQLAALKEWED